VGRYKAYNNPAYKPSLKLYLRTQVEGGPLRNPGKLIPEKNTPSKRICVVLVHGYNNHVGQASKAYYSFRAKQKSIQKSLTEDNLEKLLGDTFWPGDAKWIWGADLLDFFFYSKAVDVAKKAGPLLADLILKIPGLLEVNFIGHSLGCRLILETITLLQNRGYPAIGKICLMAAAVENEMVSRGGKFESTLLKLQSNKSKIKILFSSSDIWVLGGAFPIGQKLAGEGNFPTALGLKPTPDMLGLVEKNRIPGAGHSDYWGIKKNKQNKLSAQFVEEFFNFGDIKRRIDQLQIEEKRVVAQPRAII